MWDLGRLERLEPALRAWVARERQELDRSPSFPEERVERLLRRQRILDYVSEPDFREALQELDAFERETGF